jgi:hypothetical protein
VTIVSTTASASIQHSNTRRYKPPCHTHFREQPGLQTVADPPLLVTICHSGVALSNASLSHTPFLLTAFPPTFYHSSTFILSSFSLTSFFALYFRRLFVAFSAWSRKTAVKNTNCTPLLNIQSQSSGSLCAVPPFTAHFHIQCALYGQGCSGITSPALVIVLWFPCTAGSTVNVKLQMWSRSAFSRHAQCSLLSNWAPGEY